MNTVLGTVVLITRLVLVAHTRSCPSTLLPTMPEKRVHDGELAPVGDQWCLDTAWTAYCQCLLIGQRGVIVHYLDERVSVTSVSNVSLSLTFTSMIKPQCPHMELCHLGFPHLELNHSLSPVFLLVFSFLNRKKKPDSFPKTAAVIV